MSDCVLSIDVDGWDTIKYTYTDGTTRIAPRSEHYSVDKTLVTRAGLVRRSFDFMDKLHSQAIKINEGQSKFKECALADFKQISSDILTCIDDPETSQTDKITLTDIKKEMITQFCLCCKITEDMLLEESC